ncbi:NPTN [Mytilus edulis]|uniref:NPTN n=1 Tax=Mytilus edulis TaxID=6550 RepID=A0A8S3S8W7_MYTED|nr:NPTN [Mytilus edulis]
MQTRSLQSLLWLLRLFTSISGSTRILEGNELLQTVEKSSFSLTCEYIYSHTNESLIPIFRKNGQELVGFETNVTFNNASASSSTVKLNILKSSIDISDGGIYTCISNDSTSNVTIMVLADNSKFDQSYSFIEDKDLMLECPVPSFLQPTVTWYRDGLLLNDDRIVLSNTQGKQDGSLQISPVKTSDRGHYTCSASWSIGRKSFTTLVRVREKLAPLWPFIGIVLEVLVLVLIIMFCKDNKKKTDRKSS